MAERINGNFEMEYYLEKSLQGDADAAYEIAKYIALIGTPKEFVVQKHFKRAAMLGSIAAQRVIGIYGLCNRLITEESSLSNIHYNEDKETGFYWLNEAACAGDLLATYLKGFCYLYGLGVTQNESIAQEHFKQTEGKMSFQTIINTMMIVDFIKPKDKVTTEKIFIDGVTAIAS